MNKVQADTPANHLYHPSLLEVCVVGVLAIAGLITTTLYPVITEAWTSAGLASTEQIGRIATAEFLALALTALFAYKILPLARLRTTALIAAAVQILATLATTQITGAQLIPVRAIFGAASGVLLWIQFEFIARSPHPGRLAGIYITVMVLTAIPLSWFGPVFITPYFGVNVLILFLGCMSGAAIFAVPFGPRSLPPLTVFSEDKAQIKLTAGSFCLLVSIVTWCCWMSLLWVYAGPLSRVLAVSELAARAFVGVSLVLQILGAASAAASAERFQFRYVLSGGLIISAFLTVSLWAGVGSLAFVMCFGVYGFLGYFLVPFYVQGLAALDISRRSVVFFPGAQFLGASIGPLAASFVVSEEDFQVGLLMGLGFIIAAIMSLWAGLRLGRQRVSR